MLAKPIPEGYHSLTPNLIVKNAPRALDFYQQGFAATNIARAADPSGKTMHAEFRVGSAIVMMSEESPEYLTRSPESLGGSPVMIHLYVDDVDALARRAVGAGASLTRPLTDEARGDRVCTLSDPFGHRWMVATRKKNVSFEEQQEAAADWKILRPAGSNEAESDAESGQAVVYLTVGDGARAIEFYKKALGAVETLRFVDQAGKIGHATLRIGDSALFLSDEFLGVCSSPDRYGGSSVLIHLYVEDVDRVTAQAVAAGARLLIPVDDRPWGDRQGRLDDPFGHIWRVSTHREDVSAEELSKRVAATR